MVLIKGMKMPQNCEECDLKVLDEYDDVDYVCPFSRVIVLNIGRQGSCPLVKVPPHGRLIDADALLSLDRQIYDGEIAVGRREYIFCFEVDDAPTVIEAEEGE